MIPAIVLAAGLSSRMGVFKLTMPWDGTTVIRRVVDTLLAAGLDDVIVVTGHREGDVRFELQGTGVRFTHNPDFANSEMIDSIRCGLRAAATDAPAALLCLGDQPQVRVDTVLAVLGAGEKENWRRLIIPSYRMRSGHPILLPRGCWPRILAEAATLRSFLAGQRVDTHYLLVDSPTIHADLDTPEDYARAGQIAAQPDQE